MIAENNVEKIKNIIMTEWIFDESYFTDPVTGGFCFPKYSDTGEQPVEIVDITDYQVYFWDESKLSPKEISKYGIVDFERDLVSIESYELEIKIDNLETFARKIPDDFFRSYPKLIEYRNHLAKLVYKFGSEDAWFGSYNDGFRKTLVEYGLSCKYEPFMRGTMEWENFVRRLCSLYVYYLKSNLERFHPLYIPIVFEELKEYFEEGIWMEDNEFFLEYYYDDNWLEILPLMIKKELESKYWLVYRKNY